MTAKAPSRVTKEDLKRDLADERPFWIMSAYSPIAGAADQLIGGYPREQSFEEIRLHYLMGAMNGNAPGALNDISELYRQAEAQIQNILNNPSDAIKYLDDAENRHPNRKDICKQYQQHNQQPQQQSGTGGIFSRNANQTTANAFGQLSALGARPSAFSQPSQTPAFSQPSQHTSAFGQPSQPTSTFGQPSQPRSSFAQTAQAAPAFGQSSQPTNTFGQPSQPASAFGQPSALGAKSSPFGAPAFGKPPGGTAFSQLSQLGNSAPAFGQPSQPTSVFGPKQQQPSPTPFAAAAGSSPFATLGANNANNTTATPATSNPFGQSQQAQQSSNAFGQPTASSAANPFGQTSQPSNQQSQTQSTTPFGTNANISSLFANKNKPPIPTSAPTVGSGQDPYPPSASRQHPPVSSYITRRPDGSLQSFKGLEVTYVAGSESSKKPVPTVRGPKGVVMRIRFPDGPPLCTLETEAPEEAYRDAAAVQPWKSFLNTGRFEGGIIPEVPPKREWCQWDF